MLRLFLACMTLSVTLQICAAATFFQHGLSNIDDINACVSVKIRSTTECLLKCQRKNLQAFLKKVSIGGVDGDVTLQCYCCPHQHEMTSETQLAENQFQTYREIESCISDRSKYHGTGNSRENPIQSCRRLKEQNPCLPSGYYWLQLDVPREAYCEMEEVGGGWALIGNLTITSSTQNLSRYDFIRNLMSPDFAKMATASESEYLLDITKLQLLQNYTKFTEIRLHRFKAWHGRTMDGIFNTTGGALSFLSGVTSSAAPNNCDGMFKALPADTSVLMARPCTSVLHGGAGASIYNHPIFESYSSHVVLVSEDTRYECDDYLGTAGYTPIGMWLYYAR